MNCIESDSQIGFFCTAGTDEPAPLPGFEELAIPLFHSLYSFARRLASNQNDAEDLVQETYLKAQRNFDSFEPGTNLRAWMFRILKNTFLSSRATLDCRLTDPVEVEADTAVPLTSTTPESLLITQFTNEATRRAILQLPSGLREVIWLRHVEDASYREIAEFLSIPIGTAMSRLARGRKLVRKLLAGHRATRSAGIRRGVRATSTRMRIRPYSAGVQPVSS
jgi:RNA polymerase sigma-70 factor (ECF subfamily)